MLTYFHAPAVRFLRLLLIHSFFLLASFNGEACQCPPLPILTEDYCNKYELIFKGTILSVGQCNTINKIHFKLNELYKGISTEEIDVYYDCESDCAMNYNSNEEWIVYANYAQMGKPKIDLCSRTRKFFNNENKIETSYVNNDISFNEEQTFLTEKFGLHHFLTQNNNAEMSHQNIKPSGITSILLILISIAGFVAFYYLFNKFYK